MLYAEVSTEQQKLCYYVCVHFQNEFSYVIRKLTLAIPVIFVLQIAT